MSAPSKLIVGLGNPGRKYAKTRHNLGRMIIDKLAKNAQVQWENEGEDEIALIDNVLLYKPGAFMNVVGDSVNAKVQIHNIPTSEILTISDDMDLEFGRSKYIYKEGGHGGHKGLESVFAKVGSRNINRLRVGIGRPPSNMLPSEFVLAPFRNDEIIELPNIIDEAVDKIRTNFYD